MRARLIRRRNERSQLAVDRQVQLDEAERERQVMIAALVLGGLAFTALLFWVLT